MWSGGRGEVIDGKYRAIELVEIVINEEYAEDGSATGIGRDYKGEFKVTGRLSNQSVAFEVFFDDGVSYAIRGQFNEELDRVSGVTVSGSGTDATVRSRGLFTPYYLLKCVNSQ